MGYSQIPNSCDSLFEKGYHHFKLEEWKQSKNLFKAYETCGNHTESLFFSLGRCYLALNQEDSCIFYNNLCDSLFKSNYHWVFGNRGIAYLNLKEYAKAEKDLNRAITIYERQLIPLENDGWKLYRKHAWLNIALKKYQAAETDFGLAIEESPETAVNYCELCELYMIKGEYNRVFSMKEKIRSLQPEIKYTIIFAFYAYCARLLIGDGTSDEEKNLQQLLSQPFFIEWNFDDFNNALKSQKVKKNLVKKILKYEAQITKNNSPI